MKNIKIIYIIFASTCGIYTYGTNFAYFQNKWPNVAKEEYREDMGKAVISGIAATIIPPIALAEMCHSGFNEYGFKLK